MYDIEESYYAPQPVPVETRRKESRVMMGKNVFFGIIIIIIAAAVILGGYHLLIYLMDLGQKYFGPQEWLADRTALAWFVTSALLIAVFFALRTASQYAANIVKEIFKVGQYDVVTMIIAVVINALFMMLAGWMTHHIINFIDASDIKSFFSKENSLSVIVMFTMISGAMIWFPRTGDRYSENKFGQMDD